MSPAKVRFGVGVPTATEGMMYPVPFADVDQAVHLAVEAERLGYDSVWGNDHVSTQHYVRDEWPEPPRFYDPLSYLAYVAASTTQLRVATCILVLPFRHPVLVAKQAATLDQLSHGRFELGVGIGAYREEFEAMWPGRKVHRGDYVTESLEALERLFTQRRASYRGTWIELEDVESYPKPLQDPLPILSGGNSPGSRRRAATLATGWLPACLTVEEIADGVAEIRRIAEEGGRTLSEGFDVAPQFGVSLAATHEEAVERFESSQVYTHLRSLSKSTLKGKQDTDWTTRNLIGTSDEIGERIERYVEAGVTTFSGILFATNTVEETLEAMSSFSEAIVSRFGTIRGATVGGTGA